MNKQPRRLTRPRLVRLPVPMDERLMGLARERGETVSDLIRFAVNTVFFLPGDVSETTMSDSPTSQVEATA